MADFEGFHQMSEANSASRKFDPARADEYRTQSRIALAGYEACHELTACMLTATLGGGGSSRILVVGAGGGAQEVVVAAKLAPKWLFTAVDPSRPMLDIAVEEIGREGLAGRTDFHLGYVHDLPIDQHFDAATLIGVLHHQPGNEAKKHLLNSIADRLLPGAPLVLAGNRYAYSSQPLLLRAWGERWRMQGASETEVKAKLERILEGADPPSSEGEVEKLLQDAGFDRPIWFFSSLFWGACIAKLGSSINPKEAARLVKANGRDIRGC